MIWKGKSIPTYTIATKQWTTTTFEDFKEYFQFIESQWSLPGKYNLRHTHLWRQPALKWQKDKRYSDYEENSPEGKAEWAFEKKKIGQGIIIDDGKFKRYISGHYYNYLNYHPIVDKIKGKEDFAEVWDGQYHYDLYCLRAKLRKLNAAIVKARQKGMEQPNSEIVLTESGWRQMGDLKVGDRIYTPKGILTSIIEVFPQGIKDVYELELLDGRKVKCGLNHLWNVYDRGIYKTLSLKQILDKGLYIDVTAPLKDGTIKKYQGYKFKIPEIDAIQYSKKELKIPPYVLGVLLGDGEFKTTPRISSADPEIFNRVLSLLGGSFKYGEPEILSGHERRGIIDTERFGDQREGFENGKFGVNKLVRWIKEYGLFGKTRNNKFIPEDYLLSSIEDRIELLRGLMDTDGYINADGYDIHFTSTNLTLITQVISLCRSLGINCNISTFEQETQNTYYRVRIKPKIELFHLTKKKERQKRTIYNNKSSIISINKLTYQEESTCIMVEDKDHLYITKDFIPTHNSLYHTSRLMTNFWFIRQSVNKMVGYEEDHVNSKGSWKFLVGYRNWLNEQTPWYRTCEPDEELNWEQKRTVTEGVINTKKTFKGLRSKLVAATTKKNPAKAVGGHITELFCEESGIAPNLDKVLVFAEAATKLGGVKTGQVFCSGAVGQLQDCKPLEDISLNPEKYGFLGVEDTFSEIPTGEMIAFFFPDFWNYLADDPEKGIVKCYDDDGNSDIELAKHYLKIEDDKRKKEDNYTLWKSQHPWTLQDAFAIRETNIFPTEIIREQQLKLMASYKPLTVELYEEGGALKHKFTHAVPVNTLNVDPTKDNTGCIEIDELPVDNPPWGLYYAGVDPIRQTNTVTSKSLMSITIYKASHTKNGKLIMDYPVARYTGRHKKWEDTYMVCADLMRFYNCRSAIENNITGFIEWCVGKGLGFMLMRRKEIVMVNEWVPTSSIRDEIGIRMEGELKKKALEFAVAYVDEIIGTEYDENDVPHFIYGVSRIKDKMLLEEMLKFTPKLNTDRLIAFILAVMAARSNSNRNIITDEREQQHKPKKVIATLPSQFQTLTNSRSRGNRLPSQFGSRRR